MPKPETKINFDDFMNVDIRVGKIIQAEAYPEARKPAFKIWVDFGEEIGVLKSSAQITVHYTLDDLPGRLVAGVVNFPDKQIGKFRSEFLVLSFNDADDAVVLVHPSRDVPLGGRLQ
ncbi:MAG: tRNA-binding protein [Alphaproteobacteria bacterium]